jgi:hypothetical protein
MLPHRCWSSPGEKRLDALAICRIAAHTASAQNGEQIVRDHSRDITSSRAPPAGTGLERLRLPFFKTMAWPALAGRASLIT